MMTQLSLRPVCGGACGQPVDGGPFCPACLELIRAAAVTREFEVFAPIPGFDGYEASSWGRVRSVDRVVVRSNGIPQHCRGQLLTQIPSRLGYLQVGIYGTRSVHQLVAAAFLGPRPSGLETRHLDDVREHNSIDNLVYGTRSQNLLDMVVNGRHPQANKLVCSKGHPYSEVNTRMQRHPGGHLYRVCRECMRQAQRAHRQRKRQLAQAER